MKLIECEMSTRLRNNLLDGGITTTEEIIERFKINPSYFKDWYGMGKKTQMELKLLIMQELKLCPHCGSVMKEEV